MVRIPPIFCNFIPKVQEKSQQQFTTNPVAQPEPHFQLAKTYACPFLGDAAKFITLDLSPAVELGDVHCPCCGVKTLSEDKYNTLLKIAEGIETPKDLIQFFKANEAYIPVNMRECIFRDSSKFIDEPSLTVRDYFKDSKQLAFHTRHYYISKVNKFLTDYASLLGEGSLKTAVCDTNERLNPSGSYYEFKNLMFELTSHEDFGVNEKDYFFNHLYKNVRSANLNFGVYDIHGTSEMAPGEISKLWAAKLFKHSLITQTKMHNYKLGNDVVNNSVLVCNSCSIKAGKNQFLDFSGITDYNEAKFLMFSYLSNIARMMGEGKIHPNKYYFTNFTYYVNKLSRGTIQFTDSDIEKLLKLRSISYNRDTFAPIDQAEVDIPCACCGSTLLPHSKRLDIQLDLIRANSLGEYAEILTKYDKYIGQYSREFKDLFLDIYQNNPNLTEDEFLSEFTRRSKSLLDKEVNVALKGYDQNLRYIRNNGSQSEYNLMTIVKNRTLDYLKEGNFKDYNYSNYLNTVFYGIDLDSDFCSKGVYMLLNDMKTIAYKSTMIFPNDKYDNDDKSPLYTLLFNIFKTDVATAGHLVAPKKGGDNSKENTIGLCKGCNVIKSNKSVEAWYTQLLPIRVNFRKHLHVIDEMSKSGKIEGYEDWAKHVADSMYALTRGRYNLRDEFEN